MIIPYQNILEIIYGPGLLYAGAILLCFVVLMFLDILIDFIRDIYHLFSDIGGKY